MAEKTARRSFLSAIAAAAAAPFAGLMGRRATAADEPSWEYRVAWRSADGKASGVAGPYDLFRTAAVSYRGHRISGDAARIERRALGPWQRYEQAEHMAAELAAKGR
jgi:hypothetical protein